MIAKRARAKKPLRKAAAVTKPNTSSLSSPLTKRIVFFIVFFFLLLVGNISYSKKQSLSLWTTSKKTNLKKKKRSASGSNQPFSDKRTDTGVFTPACKNIQNCPSLPAKHFRKVVHHLSGSRTNQNRQTPRPPRPRQNPTTPQPTPPLPPHFLHLKQSLTFPRHKNTNCPSAVASGYSCTSPVKKTGGRWWVKQFYIHTPLPTPPPQTPKAPPTHLTHDSSHLHK